MGKFPKFYGELHLYSQWEKEVDLHFFMYRLSEIEQLSLAVISLRSRAKRWFHRHEAKISRMTTWEELKSLMHKRFLLP